MLADVKPIRTNQQVCDTLPICLANSLPEVYQYIDTETIARWRFMKSFRRVAAIWRNERNNRHRTTQQYDVIVEKTSLVHFNRKLSVLQTIVNIAYYMPDYLVKLVYERRQAKPHTAALHLSRAYPPPGVGTVPPHAIINRRMNKNVQSHLSECRNTMSADYTTRFSFANHGDPEISSNEKIAKMAVEKFSLTR